MSGPFQPLLLEFEEQSAQGSQWEPQQGSSRSAPRRANEGSTVSAVDSSQRFTTEVFDSPYTTLFGYSTSGPVNVDMSEGAVPSQELTYKLEVGVVARAIPMGCGLLQAEDPRRDLFLGRVGAHFDRFGKSIFIGAEDYERATIKIKKGQFHDATEIGFELLRGVVLAVEEIPKIERSGHGLDGFKKLIFTSHNPDAFKEMIARYGLNCGEVIQGEDYKNYTPRSAQKEPVDFVFDYQELVKRFSVK